MPSSSSPRQPLNSRSGRRFVLTFAVVFGGMVLFGVLPASAHAGTMHMSRFAMTSAAMTHTMNLPPMTVAALSQAAPTPQASMSPLPQARNVEASPELRKVLDSILCQCGCGLTAYACEGTMLCSVSSAMRKDAERMLASGMTADQAIEAFAADYGEGILAAPPKSGFDLTAWVLPFVVLGAGGLLVGFSIRAWRPKATAAGAGEVEVQPDPRYLERIEKELEQED